MKIIDYQPRNNEAKEKETGSAKLVGIEPNTPSSTKKETNQPPWHCDNKDKI